jgi:hypothetical protein
MLRRSDRIVWIEDGLIAKISTPEEMNIKIEEVH